MSIGDPNPWISNPSFTTTTSSGGTAIFDTFNRWMAMTCYICGTETENISFRFGYGSKHDGDAVCMECAKLIDPAIDVLRAKIHPWPQFKKEEE